MSAHSGCKFTPAAGGVYESAGGFMHGYVEACKDGRVVEAHGGHIDYTSESCESVSLISYEDCDQPAGPGPIDRTFCLTTDDVLHGEGDFSWTATVNGDAVRVFLIGACFMIYELSAYRGSNGSNVYAVGSGWRMLGRSWIVALVIGFHILASALPHTGRKDDPLETLSRTVLPYQMQMFAVTTGFLACIAELYFGPLERDLYRMGIQS